MTAKADFFIGLFLIVFSAAAYLIAGRLPVVRRGLGPGDYPKVVILGILAMGILLSGTALFNLKTQTNQETKKYEKGELKQVAILVVCIALYLILVYYLGFLLLTPPFMFMMMYIFGQTTWIKMIAISVITTVAVYVIFNNFLLVLLPGFILL